jgi:hypothetical protein
MAIPTTPQTRVRKPVKAEIERDEREATVAKALAALSLDPGDKILVKMLVSRASPSCSWKPGDEAYTRADRAARMFIAAEASAADERAKQLFEQVESQRRPDEIP